MAVAAGFLYPSPWRPASPSQPATFTVDADKVSVFDANGRRLFAKPWTGPCDRVTWATETRPTNGARFQIDDFDGDGRREVVYFEAASDRRYVDELQWLDASGALIRRYRPGHIVRFGKTDYPPPWGGHWLFVTRADDGKPTLWAVWVHQASGWFPCLLQSFSADGKPQSEYWSAGYVEAVTAATVRGVRSILVGAHNNDQRGASLAVFDARSVQGSAPALNPDKICHGCPPGQPRAFMVFPRMELRRLIEGVPLVSDVRQQSDGALRVWVDQSGGDLTEPMAGTVTYDLSPDLVPFRAAVNREYEASHRMVEARGLIDHPFGDRDYRELWPVQVWKNGAFVPVTGTVAR